MIGSTQAEAVAAAQRLANRSAEPWGVWEHVGDYGRPSGDIAARHTFLLRRLSTPDPASDYALVACVDPEPRGSCNASWDDGDRLPRWDVVRRGRGTR